MTESYDLFWLDGSDAAAATQVARLHRSLLGHSPAALLGERFLAHYYYRVLPRLQLIEVMVARVDGEVSGFLAVTADADGFMRRAAQRAPVKLGASLTAALVADPRRLAPLLEAASISRNRTSESSGGGELLSFAVSERVRDPKFMRSRGIRVGTDLIAGAIDRLRSRGVAKVRALVDADNKPVRILYGAMGWKLVDGAVPGWRTPQVEFSLPLQEQQVPAD